MGLREALDAEDFAFTEKAEEAIAILWNLARNQRELERVKLRLLKLERAATTLCNGVVQYARGDDLKELENATDAVMEILRGETS